MKSKIDLFSVAMYAWAIFGLLSILVVSATLYGIVDATIQERTTIAPK